MNAMKAVRIEAFRSEHVIVTLQLGSKRHKILRLFFGRDGSLYVSFPYFRYHTGILAVATIPGNGQNTSQLNLQTGGKVASHLVKYSHHPDGRAHFSQDGKVFTQIKRQSVALDRQCGHIFTVQIQGIEGFDAAADKKDIGTSPKRTSLTFDLPEDSTTQTIKVVGRWFDISGLTFSGQRPSVIGPLVPAQDAQGKQQNGFIVASPYDNVRHVLLLTCEPIAKVSSEPESLLFYGGFSPRSVMDDTSQEAGFLAFVYPVAEAENLRKIIGTIDR
jgi:hypothetical protein